MNEQSSESRYRDMRIHIDRARHESPNPTTGAALYVLGRLLPGYVLFREVEGDHEDKVIRNDQQEIHLTEDEHFYGSLREEYVTIVVEGTPHEWPKNEPITYAQVVTLEVPGYAQQSGITYSVTYKNGQGNKPEGVLVPGASVKVKESMVFNVSETGQS